MSARMAGPPEESEGQRLQSALYRIAEEANSARALQDLFAAIHDILGELIYARNCFIALYDAPAGMLHFPYWVDEKDPAATPTERPSRPLGKGLTEYLLAAGKPVLLSQEQIRQLIARGEVELIGPPSTAWLGVPLKVADRLLGALVLQTYERSRMYGEKEREVLTFVSHHIASAIEHRRSQEAIRESESKYRGIFETVAEGIFQTTVEGGWVTANPSLATMMGYDSPRQMMDELDVNRIYVRPGRREEIARLLVERMEVTGIESEVYRRDGSVIWVTETTRTVRDASGRVTGFVGTVQDVTARKRDIAERKRAEQLKEALYRISKTASSAEDLPQLYAAVHQTLSELIYAKNCYIALYDRAAGVVSFPYFVDEQERAPAPRKFAHGFTEYVLRTGQPFLSRLEMVQNLVTSGEVATIGSPSFDWMGVPLKKGNETFGVLAVQTYDKDSRYGDKEKEILTFVSQHVADAIERKRAQDALTHSEARYRSLVETAVYGIFRVDSTRFLAVNPALVAMLGYDSEEELLKVDPVKDVYGDPELYNRFVIQHLAQNAGLSVPNEIEEQWKRKDGTLISVRLTGRVLPGEHGQPGFFQGAVEDVTDRRRLEEQFRQSQKMQAVGRLAGGVAHDFNNLLTIIQGHTEMALQNYADADPRRAELQEVLRAAERASGLTRQLLAFSRQQVLAPQVLDLNDVVGNMRTLLQRLIGEDVALESTLDPGAGKVKADLGQLEQVIMNLAVNARDAMPRGGRLGLRTASAFLAGEMLRDRPQLRPGSYVMLAVSDTGVGMSPEVRSRIFEPFYTTKGPGKGTGLGLSTVYGIVQQSGGDIWVDSQPGMGTTFRIYLPREEGARAEAQARAAPRSQRSGTETILLVEDEDGVRALARRVLQKKGYSVLEARSGDDALQLAQNHAAPIDLLLTDVVLANRNGPEVAQALMPLRPGMKVLYMSGYTDDAILQRGALAPGMAFLQKPFAAETLADKVREVLDS